MNGPYRIYRNLHHKTWTVQHKVPHVGWRKLESHKAIYVARADFTVSDAGRRRARLEGRKNVHAFAVVEDFWPMEDQSALGRLMDVMEHTVTYSPFNGRGFTCDAMDNIQTANVCLFAWTGKIYAYNVEGGWKQLKLEDELGVIRV